MDLNHVLARHFCGEKVLGVKIRESVRIEITAVEGGLSIDDVFGDELAGHWMVAEAARAEVGAQVALDEKVLNGAVLANLDAQFAGSCRGVRRCQS